MQHTPNALWEQAACATPPHVANREIWFAERDKYEDLQAAITICHQCPIRTLCLETAMAEEEGNGRKNRWGIRGGLTPRQRWNADHNVSDREPRPPTKPLSPCGTRAAYERHLRNREIVDQPCRDAYAEDKRNWRQAKRATTPTP